MDRGVPARLRRPLASHRIAAPINNNVALQSISIKSGRAIPTAGRGGSVHRPSSVVNRARREFVSCRRKVRRHIVGTRAARRQAAVQRASSRLP